MGVFLLSVKRKNSKPVPATLLKIWAERGWIRPEKRKTEKFFAQKPRCQRFGMKISTDYWK